MSDGSHTVHIRVNDAATGRPTPVRLRCAGPDGAYYAPFGRLCKFSTDPGRDVGGNVLLHSKAYAYIDGACEIRLPSGPVIFEVHKGPEYRSLIQETRLGVGQMAVRLTIEHLHDLSKQGWYSGDARCHYLSPHAALLEAGAEGLAVVNLLALEGETTISNILAFSGQKSALEADGRIVVVNTLNYHPVLGSLALLNSHRAVYPLRFGGPNGWENWTLADWCDQCHRKGGLTIGSGGLPGELLADVILGKVDAMEVIEEVPSIWYVLIEAGFRVPLVGASGKTSNREALGSCRTYARLEPNEEFNYKHWIEAIRAGRTFVTRGPLLLMTVDDHDAGALIEVPSPGGKVRVRAEVLNPQASDSLEIVMNDAVVAQRSWSDDRAAVFEAEIAVTEPGWLAARYWGQRIDGMGELAHTSPVYIQVPGQPPWRTAQALATLNARLDEMVCWVEKEARFENDKQKEDLTGVFRSAKETLRQRANPGG